MQKGEIELTQKDAENTPAGGVVVGKRDGQTMIYDDASLGGYFVGKLHKDGGIKMINKSTGQPLEVQGSEIIITAPAVNDPTKHNFNGKMMTNREILSKINSDGGGVSFADGGDIPAKIHTTEKEYKYGGKMVHDSDIAHSLGMNSTLKKGKQQFYSGGMTYDVDAIYNAVKKGKLRLKTKEVDTFPMKYPVYDKQYSETVKTDLRKPNGIMVRLESGEEVLIDGNHRMNNAYLKGRKTMKTYYVEDPKQIGKFVKKSKFELVGENKKASIMAKKDISSHYNELNDPFDDRKDSENWRKYALPYDTKFDIEFKKGGHLSKNKSLRQIAEMHNVSLVYINEELAKGLEVEKEHFSDFKERTRVAKDHLVENPNYYTLLSKAGLKNGGSFNYGGSVSKENEFAFNKKSDRLKSFYKTNNPSIDSLLMECQTFINELVEQQKKLVLKLSLDTNGIETPMSEFAIEQYEIGLIFKMVQSFNKYLKTTDILTDVTIKNVGLFEISATVIRDGKKYSFRTELIPAGGYNIQEFHYRYITKTDLPESKENSAIDNLKSKLSVFKKIKSLEDDINRNIKSISDLEKYIKQGYYGDDDDDKLYRVDLNKEAILYEQENIERYKKEIEKLKIKQNDLESVLISLNKLKNGGHILSHHRHSENLVKDAKSGNTPARDLNNYNDIMDLGADEAVGGDSGLAFADGGEIKDIEPYFERFNRIGLSGVDYVMKSQVNFMDFESDLYSAQRGIENKYVGYEKFPFHEFVKKYDYVTKKDYYYSNQEHKAEIDLLVEKLKKEGYTVLAKTYSFTKGASQGFNKNNKAINVFAFKLKSYAKGGVVYDTTKPKIQKVTIKETKYDRASVIGRNASTISELQFIVRDYLGYSTKEDVDWIKFYVNDNTRGGYYINLNKGKKNTVANVNPETLNSSNFKRVIDANSYLAKNYDWTDFFEGATASKQMTKDNSVTAISINYDNATTGKSGGMDLATSTSKLYSDLIGLYQNRSQNVTIQPIGNKLGVNPIEINIYSEDWQTILFKQPLEIALTSINRILYGLFPDLNFDNIVSDTIAISQTPASTSVKPFDFSMTKIWIGNNPELSKKVQEYAFTNGFSWANGGEKKPLNTEQPCLVFSKYGNKEGFITYRRDRTNFDNVSKDHKEITEADIFGTQTPTSFPTPASTSVKPFDFSLTKIDVSNNPDLSQKVQKRAFELGWEWENGGGKTIDYDSFNYLYFTKTSISSGNTNSSFVKSPKREITEAEIFGNQTPVTASTSTTTVSKDNSVDLVELRYRKGVVDYVNQSRTGEELLQKFNTIEDYLLKNPNETISVYISAEVTDKTGKITATTINIDIGKNGLKPSNFSYDEMKELIQEKWFNGKLDFNEFFNKSKPNSAKPFDLSKTKIKVDGDRNLSKKIQEKAFELGWGWDFVNKNDVQSTGAYCLLFDENKQIDAYYTEVAFKEATDYREITVDELFGSQTSTSSGKFTEGEIGLFKKIDKLIKDNSFAEVTLPINLWSKGADTKLFDLVDDDTLEVFSFRSYEINLGGVSEDSGNGRTVEILEKYVDWKSLGSQTSLSNKEKVRFLALTSDSGGYKNVSNLTEIKDTIEGIFSANRGKDESIILFANGLNGSSFTINFGDNRTCETCYDTLTDGKQRIKDIILFYSDADKYDWSDFFEEEQTPSSTTVVPKKVENAVYDLDVAISKLEKASSVVVSDYNKDVYDQSLKFLYDTRATYELALKFTPESAFMYERLDIMKKLADIEKNIKKIEDMKKGGAFYMLAKILEKLQRGENWRLMEQTQDVITNQLPQSEIDIIIRSQKFKNWFGDWEKALVNDEYDNVSKALTNGIPSVYHHGARRKKYTYREVSNGVLYLAENISYALWFSQNATAQSEEGNYLTECFVNIKNPIDLTAFHVKMIDLGDLVRYIDAIYPMAKIYDFIPAQVALLIKANQPTNVMMWAWQLIRKYAKFVNHIKENTPYDGFLYYENNPSDEVLNPITGQMEENVTKAVAIFKSPQVKVVDAVLFDGGFDDWRFENGGKIKN